MKATLKATLAAVGLAFAGQAAAEVVFYQHDGFQGRSFTTAREVRNFERAGFNDEASSVVVFRERWEVCEDNRFGGRCVILRPGRYPSLGAMGLNDRVSSVRPVSREVRIEETRYAPPAVPVYDSRRRGGERFFEAQVTSVRAVVGTPQQRCWVDREQVSDRGSPNVGGAIAGALIGGILGHQVGSGRGNDAATVGGAVAGAAIGANANRDRGGQAYFQDVQRCSTVSEGRPEYYDVTYAFQGQEHRVQMANPPGPSITVNQRGEPRS